CLMTVPLASSGAHRYLHSFPTRRSSDLVTMTPTGGLKSAVALACAGALTGATCTVSPSSVTAADGVTPQQAQVSMTTNALVIPRSEEHTSELQSLAYLVCRLLLEKNNNN